MTNPPKVGQEPWHVSRSVPISLIFAIIVQTLGLVWWTSQLSSEVKQHSAQILSIQKNEASRVLDDRRTIEALARLDERMLGQTRILERLEKTLTNGSR